jgi:chromosome segregation ATPase
MEELLSKIQMIREKALFFKQKATDLELRVTELESELEQKNLRLDASIEEIEHLKSSLAETQEKLESHSQNSSSLNERIDELVREIDVCLEHLK